LIEQYLLDVSLRKKNDIPLEVYIAFPKSLTDESVAEHVKTAWLYGNNREVVNMDLLTKDRIPLLFRPVGIMIDWYMVTVSVYAPSGVLIRIPLSLLKSLGNDTLERVNNLHDYIYVEARKEKNVLVAEKLIALRGKIETGIAEQILNNTDMSVLEIILTGLGYKPTKEVKRLFTPRIVAWFKGFDGNPLHIAQFTLPETGKTTFGLRSETLFNWRYIPEPPTLARLVLDGRTGVLGEVFMRNGLVFDEFDKWSLDSADRQYTFEAILTGMEQGRWERGISAQGTRVPEMTRHIPIVFFGNLGKMEDLSGIAEANTRAWFTTVYSKQLKGDMRPLADRLTWIDVCFKEIRIMDYVTYKVLPDSVIRGIVQIIQNDVKPCDVSKLRGRLKRHSNNLYAVLSQMIKVTPEMVDGFVSGNLNLDDILS